MGSFNKVLYFECVRGSTGHFRQGDCFDTRPGGRDTDGTGGVLASSGSAAGEGGVDPMGTISAGS